MNATITLFDPARLPAPDEDGYFSHPDLDLMTDDNNEERFDLNKFSDAGFEAHATVFEYDAPDHLQVRYFEDGESGVGDWKPTPPDGDGWQLVGICDTENSPIGYFVRSVAEKQSISGEEVAISSS